MATYALNPELVKVLQCSDSDLDYLSELEPAQQQMLLEQLEHARARQHEHVRQAGIDAVNHLPRLLRKPLLKLFES